MVLKSNQIMKRLTTKEKEIMDKLWKHGPMHVREIVELYPEPKPHFNTVSTQVRILEINGLVRHIAERGTYLYEAAVSEEEYGKWSLSSVVKNYFGDSYLSAVSALVQEKKLSRDELASLIDQIEKGE